MADLTKYSLKVESQLTTTYIIIASCIIIANIISKPAEGIIITIPDDSEVLIGQLSYFNCSSSFNDKNMNWYFYPVGVAAHDRKYVYVSGELLNTYVDKFQIELGLNGVCNLVINAVALEDAGRYECQEDEGMGERKSAELVVLEADPICSSSASTNELIGPNSCGIEPDVLRLSCSVTYHGNIHPVMEWKSSKENESIVENSTSVNKGDNSVTHHLTIKADFSINGTTYVCQIAKSTTGQQAKPNCSSETIHLLYVFNSSLTVNASVGDEIVCVANTSQSCDYKWKWFENDGFTTESYNSILVPKKTGWHRCETMCVIRTHSCTITVITAYILSAKSSSFDTGKILQIVIPIAIVVVAAIIVIVITVYNWKLKGQGTQPKEELVELNRPPPVNTEFSQNETSEPTIRYTKQPELLMSIDAAYSVWGLALLNNELFVASTYERFLTVFDPSTLTELRKVSIHDLESPRDIASCQLNNCIYLVGESTESLACIDGEGKILREWELQDQPCNLSVIKSGNIIVTCNSRILEYMWDGTLLRNIELDKKELNMIWHSILLNSGNFVVCQGWEKSEYHYVLMLDPQGKILRSCGGGRGEYDCKLNNPVYLARDKDGYIFVADSGDNSVVLLNKDLQFERRYLKENQDISEPYRILLDESSGRLYVGFENGKLLVFKVF